MKLLNKINKTYLIFSAILFLLAGILLYFIMVSTIKEETTEKLYVNCIRIIQRIENGKEISQIPPILEVKQLSGIYKEKAVINDTTLYDPVEKETELFREITLIKKINNKYWRITLRQAMLETDEYLSSIGISLAIVLVILLIGLYLFNRYNSNKIWQPFYNTIYSLSNFSIHKNKRILLPDSNIAEFNQLNAAIKELTEKVISDYSLLKEFTENASHEIQTPLAIIQSQLEQLMQFKNLNAKQIELIESTFLATKKLSKLNKSLLLITKIENNQFIKTELIDVAEIIHQLLLDYSEIIELKQLSVIRKFKQKLIIKANRNLLEILSKNLLSNAIKHNIYNGTIKIEIENNFLFIANSGEKLNDSTETMFNRFKKSTPESDSLGLGLAIVKSICDINNWSVIYETQDNWHKLKILF
jgi:signal transduction histidine kinase